MHVYFEESHVETWINQSVVEIMQYGVLRKVKY